ncbi:MAG: RNA 3'-terminal phosphate cyclase [Methanothrix sp.]|jgi:RNA 3'-terminal phosphate cyclase (ATP)|nr:RNA 3'-terminal phosphate cyclase [Methanothrix sp.]
MIEIDGSFGEGGGQIVRTAVALSAVTGKPVHISKIRQGRSKPGLAAQHARAITALAAICDARTSGATPGSSEIIFAPGMIRGGSHRVEIGTAGSVTLLMQCLLPALLRADAPSSLRIQGGTDVQWSPAVDYFKNVFLPALSSFGANVSLEVLQRGYYPRGQGEVLLEVEPAKLKASHLEGRIGEICQSMQSTQSMVQGVSHCSNLPEHVAARQADSAVQALAQAGYAARITEQALRLPSMGSGITLWSGYKGASGLGERGLPAEKVGRRAAEELIIELKSPARVDVHLADQLIPYLAMAGGSYTVREISLHARTNIWTAGHFLDAEIEIKEEKGIFRIESVLHES